MRNTFIGIATVMGALAVWMGLLLNPSYPVPPKGIVLVTGQRGLRGLGREVKKKSISLSSRSEGSRCHQGSNIQCRLFGLHA
jgi:hypothetical protein